MDRLCRKNGLKGAIDIVDLTPIANAPNQSYQAMAQVKQQIYDITGISDIIRGQTNASETATAQQLKGNTHHCASRPIKIKSPCTPRH